MKVEPSQTCGHKDLTREPNPISEGSFPSVFISCVIALCRILTYVSHASKQPVILIRWSNSASILMMVLQQPVRFRVIVTTSPPWPRHDGRLTPCCLLMRATAVMLTACVQAACACMVLSRTCVVAIVNRRDARRVGRCCCYAVSMLDHVQRPDVQCHSVPRSVKTRNVGGESSCSSSSNLSAGVLPT